MKVNFSKEAKKYITVAELPIIKEIQSYMKDYDASHDAEHAIMLYFGEYTDVYEVYSFKMEIGKSRFVWNAWGEGSHDIDVRCEVKALTDKGFVILSYSLDDYWQIDSTDETKDRFRRRAYARQFKEC